MNKERLLQTFLDLVKIDSPSRHEGKVASYCKEALESLGFTVCFDASNGLTGSETGNLVAWLPSSGEDMQGSFPVQAPIVLTAHMDCVQPCEGVNPLVVEDTSSNEGATITSDGSTVLGSDDKAGVAAILEAVRCVVGSGVPHKGIVITFTVCEEIGCLGAKYLEQELFDKALCQAAGSDAFLSENCLIPCAVFDSDGDAGTIIVGAPYHYTFSAEIVGRASHAGVEPEAGVSAISVASYALNQLEWGRLDEATTSNIGRIEGGQVNNIVAQACRVTGECRSLEQARVEEVRDRITDAFEQAAEEFGLSSFAVTESEESAEANDVKVKESETGISEACASETGITLEWTLEYPGFFYSENDELIQLLSDAACQAGLESVYKTTGGGSDANVLAVKGVSPVVVGVGMTNFHTTEEYITVRNLEGAAVFAENLMKAN